MRPLRQAAKLTLTAEEKIKLPRNLNSRAGRLLAQAARASQRNFSSVNVAFVSKLTMRQLNRTYRRHDRVTDVLSFTYNDDPISGELVICLDQAQLQAKRHAHSLLRELEVLITHGLLHLAGHDHMKLKERTVMRSLERRVLGLAS